MPYPWSATAGQVQYIGEKIVNSLVLANHTFRRILKGNENISHLHDTVHDRDISTGNLVHCDVACMIAFTCGVGEEKKVAAVKGWFH